jgi:hypothetical protein
VPPPREPHVLGNLRCQPSLHRSANPLPYSRGRVAEQLVHVLMQCNRNLAVGFCAERVLASVPPRGFSSYSRYCCFSILQSARMTSRSVYAC